MTPPAEVDASGLHVWWERRPASTVSTPFAALALRLMLTFFFLAHLYSKFFTRDGFWGWWAALRHNHSAYVPIYVLTVEFSCALLLPLGLRTRWVALWAIRSFLGIIQFWLHTGGYFFTTPGADFPIMWLCMLVLQIILDDGAYALKITRSPTAGWPRPSCHHDS